ncbi:hypothetical protein NDS46_29960 (plasmid) [Paenibacillus thiaminolyticus]|uniref:hypothetical protein n=1 Tax=Paenibacillus thiaminolyticus TaxID=49283 RepID=UPI00232A85F8|nr:hypothetical protein [Paenibacillus thiaminolyticus]WCF11574.1 hypothetical protein NDS46_29960 [Paenibacillus thiaminolyticus]
MEKITITIETCNSAFDDDVEYEVARILKSLARKLEGEQRPEILRDANGNKVGKVEYE